MINYLGAEEIMQEFSKLEQAEGDLVLVIGCRKCDALFELDRECVALAIMTGQTILSFINAIQQRKCKICEGEQKDRRKELER